MKRIALALAAVAAVTAPALAETESSSKGEARLSRLLEGRSAGEGVDCLPTSRVSSAQVIDGTAIVYRVGSTLYVNRPRAGAEDLDRHDTMLTRQFGSRLCRHDVVQLYQTGAGILSGLVFLSDFVPYRQEGARR